MAGRRWTEEELALLGTASDDEVARRLRRTVGAIKNARLKFRIAALRPNGWTDQEISLLGTGTDSQIGIAIGRSAAAVAKKRMSMRIPPVLVIICCDCGGRFYRSKSGRDQRCIVCRRHHVLKQKRESAREYYHRHKVRILHNERILRAQRRGRSHCCECGEEFEKTTTNVRCKECQAARNRLLKSAYAARNPRPTKIRPRHCHDCGRTFRKPSHIVRCGACSKEHHRLYLKTYHAKNKRRRRRDERVLELLSLSQTLEKELNDAQAGQTD